MTRYELSCLPASDDGDSFMPWQCCRWFLLSCCLVGCGRDSRLRVVLVMLRDTWDSGERSTLAERNRLAYLRTHVSHGDPKTLILCRRRFSHIFFFQRIVDNDIPLDLFKWSTYKFIGKQICTTISQWHSGRDYKW